jgi:hypothetical protein
MTVENGDNMVIYKGFQPLKTKQVYLSTFCYKLRCINCSFYAVCK